MPLKALPQSYSHYSQKSNFAASIWRKGKQKMSILVSINTNNKHHSSPCLSLLQILSRINEVGFALMVVELKKQTLIDQIHNLGAFWSIMI